MRPDASTSPRPSFCHTYGRSKSEHRMLPNWPYSVVAALKTGRTSWTATLDATRLPPGVYLVAVSPRRSAATCNT
ncbi:transposase [Lentzea sp. NPDC059081]|uniref:transposase n=1 Tax=Lentzea sp. NPDC059081 TaxID=3346719 RepID=UPI0036BFB7E6